MVEESGRQEAMTAIQKTHVGLELKGNEMTEELHWGQFCNRRSEGSFRVL